MTIFSNWTPSNSGYQLVSTTHDAAAKPKNSSFQQNYVTDMAEYMISRPPGWALNEKMLKVLSLFKESPGGGILARVWIPMNHGDQLFLSNCE